jgi:hypothetical protein
VNGCLGLHIPKSQYEIVLIYNVGGDFFANDFTENGFTHKVSIH